MFDWYVGRLEQNLLGLGLAAVILTLGAWGASATILDAGTTNSSGLIAEYRFDTGAGNTAYDTSGNNDGNINGASWTGGVKEGSLKFDGSDDFIETGYTEDPSEVSLSAWIKIDQSMQNNYGSIISKYRGDGSSQSYEMLSNDNGGIRFHTSGTKVDSTATLDAGRWYHVVSTWNGDAGKIYINGRLDTSDSSLSPNNNDINWEIGRSPRGDNYFNGKIDNARIYSKPLNHSQIQSLYNSGSWRIGATNEEDDPSKVLDISFQHQNNTHVYDTSGYENHGTRENGVGQASSVDCKVGRCYSFDGNNDYINIGDRSVSSQNGITVMGWFRNPSGSRWISRDRSDYWNLGDYGWEVSDGSISDINNGGWTSAIREDEWTHVAAIFNPDTGFQAVYLNGKLQASQTLSSFGEIGIGTSRDVTLGCNVENDGRGSYPDGCYSVKYSGKMDQIKVFNRSLSQSEIVEKTQGLDSGGAVLDLRFNRDGGDLAEDSSGRNNHGGLEPNEETGPKRTGGSLRFDGLDDRVEIPDGGTLDYTGGGLGISVWFRENDSGTGSLVSKPWNGGGDYNYRLDLQGNNKIKFRLEGNDENIHSIVSNPVRSEVTQHIFAVEDDGRMALYLNGDKVAEESHDIDTWTPSDGDGNRNLAVGTVLPYGNSWSGDKGFSFEGEILKVERKNYVPSSKRIEQIYQSGVQNQQRSISEPRPEPVLSHTFDRIETCGRSDTITCPSGASGEIAVDESGKANHGELIDEPQILGSSDCRVSRCLEFDGRNGFVEVDGSGLGASNLTVSVWANFDDLPNQGAENHRIIQTGSYNLDVRDNGGNTVQYQLIPVSGPQNREQVRVSPEGSGWVHVVGTFDNSTGDMELYFDGRQVASRNLDEPLASTKSDVGIGGKSGGSRVMNGTLDQLKVYDKKLNGEEIWRLYAQGRDRSTSSNGPMKHFTGSSSLQSVTDRVGRDGTLGSDISRETSDPDVASGYIGTGLEFSDSDNEYVEVENPVDPTDASESMSVSFWLKPDSGTGKNALVEWSAGGGPDAHIWQYESEDDFYFNPRGSCSSGEATGAVKLDQWAHYTVLYDAPENEFRWYVDGKLVKSATESCQIDTSSDKLRLGNRVGSKDALDGKLDEVRIFPYALSEKQIREEASAGVKPGKSVYGIPNSCEEVQERSGTEVSGIRKIDPDGPGGQPPVDVYCGNSVDGGGWTLVYNYDHKGGTDPDVVEGKWPKSEGAFSHVDGISSYGFQSSDIEEVRFYCETSNHDRKVHYKTRDRDVVQGILDNSSTIGHQSVANDSAKLAGHTGFLPDAAGSDTGESEPGPSMFGPGFPMFEGGDYHWSIGEPNRGGSRWECDDFPGGAKHDTLHQIWVR